MKKTTKTAKEVALLVAFSVMCNMSFTTEEAFAANTNDEFVIEDTVGTDSDTNVDYTEEVTDEDYEGDDKSDEDWDESEIELSDDELTLKIGGQQTLAIDGDYDDVTWSSSRASIAKVDSDGEVTGVKAGTATIYAEVTYTVYNMDDASESDDYDYYIESCNEEEEDTYYPFDNESEEVSEEYETEEDWDDESEEEVYSVTLECQVTVTSNVKLSASKLTLKVGKSKKLKVYGGTSSVKWSSNKKKVAVVSNTGVVTAKKKGTTVITAKVNGKTLKCKVKVKK